MPFNTLSNPRKSRNFLRVYFSMIFSVSPIANAFAVKAILNLHLIPSLVSTRANSTNYLSSIFEPSVAKHLLVLIFSWKIIFNTSF
jgi:hypothetical protein